MPKSLSKKVLTGAVWLFALRLINRCLGFLRTIILARILSPVDFGLLGVAFLVISTLETFSHTGFNTALIQKKNNIDSYLNTAWTVAVIRGILLFIILFFSAPVISKFFDNPNATWVIRIVAITTLLSGFRNIGILFFQKELQFNKQFLYEVSATVTDFTVSIALVFVLRNVWALVWAGIAANMVRLIVSYIIHPHMPKIEFRKKKFKQLFGYGKWVLGWSIILFLITKGDDILVGKMFGIKALGFYQMAFLISNLPTTEITHVVSQIAMPAYSKIQDNKKRLTRALLKSQRIITLITFPLSFGLLVLAQEFTSVFLGEKWLPIYKPLQVMCIFGLVRSVAASFGPIYPALAKVDIPFKISTIQLLFLSFIVYPLSLLFDIMGIAIAVTFSSLIALYLNSKEIIQILNTNYSTIYKNIFPSLCSSILMMVVILILKRNLGNEFSLLSMIFLTAIGALCYFVFLITILRAIDENLFKKIKKLYVEIA